MDDDKELARLNQELSEQARDQHWGLYRNTLFQIGELLREKGSFEEKSCGDESFEIGNTVCLST